MKQFNQYINEGYESISDPFELHNRINKDCKYYLRLIKGEEPLYRGMDLSPSNFGGLKDVRQDRRPKGMDFDVADGFNKWLVKNGHTSRAQSVMATGNKEHVDNFGQPYMIFPTGSFSYTWIKTLDANMTDYENGWSPERLTTLFDPRWKGREDPWIDQLMVRKWGDKQPKFETFFTTNKGFKIALKKGYEIWIRCKSYYYAHNDHYIWDSRDNHLWFTK